MANGLGSIPSGIVGRMRGLLEPQISKDTANPAQAKQSPAMRNPGAQLGGLQPRSKAADGDVSTGTTRRAGLPGDQAKNTAMQVAGAGIQAVGHVLPTAAAIPATAIGSMMMASGSGDPDDPTDPEDGDKAVADHGVQMNNFLRQSKAMAEIDNRMKIASMLINGQSKMVSALASVGNKGTEDVANAAKGQ